MAIIRLSEMRKMKPEDQETKLIELRMELARLRATQAMGGTPENPSRINVLRKTIARLMTVQHEASSLEAEEEKEDESED
jgi:large subunit ribosomal protein L29